MQNGCPYVLLKSTVFLFFFVVLVIRPVLRAGFSDQGHAVKKDRENDRQKDTCFKPVSGGGAAAERGNYGRDVQACQKKDCEKCENTYEFHLRFLPVWIEMLINIYHITAGCCPSSTGTAQKRR